MLRPPNIVHDFVALRGAYPVRASCNDAAVHLLADPLLLEDLDLSKPLPSPGDVLTSSLRFVVDGARIDAATATHADLAAVVAGAPPGLACSDEAAAALPHGLAHSLSALACWPRLVLDGVVGGSDANPVDAADREELVVVESRDAYRCRRAVGPGGADREADAPAAGDDDEGPRIAADEPAESHWDTAVALLSKEPVAVVGGSVVELTFEAVHGERVDKPSHYTIEGEVRTSSGAGCLCPSD